MRTPGAAEVPLTDERIHLRHGVSRQEEPLSKRPGVADLIRGVVRSRVGVIRLLIPWVKESAKELRIQPIHNSIQNLSWSVRGIPSTVKAV